MPRTLLNRFTFLAFALIARARPQDVEMAGSFALGAVNDWASSGNYLIYGCASEVPDVQNILDLTYLALQTAILSTDTSAYRAFFRSASPSSVTAVLEAITLGTNITATPYGSHRPTMVCVNALDVKIRTFWKICQDSENTIIIQPPGTAIVFLCPLFFDRALFPHSTDCGTVNHAKTKLIAHSYIAGTQYGFLLQALADMYIRDTKGVQILAQGRDVKDENACLALPPDQALTNPSSYAFYASNVRAGCTQFPSRVSIQRDRELLAMEGGGAGGNGTANLTASCLGVGNSSSPCSL